MKKDYIIFDMDGTLADTLPLTLQAFSELTGRFGFVMPDAEVVRAAVGYAAPEFYLRIFPEADPDAVCKLGDAVEEAEQALTPTFDRDFLFAGVRELLDELECRGIKTAIASTGGLAHVFSVLNHAGVTRRFDPILCDRPDKTAMLAEILAGRDPSRFLMVGDMEKDSAAARANGITSVGARFGYLGDGVRGFDLFIDRPQDLLKLL